MTGGLLPRFAVLNVTRRPQDISVGEGQPDHDADHDADQYIHETSVVAGDSRASGELV